MTMTMTSKDFGAIAEAIAEAKRTVQYSSTSKMAENAGLKALEAATRELATACHAQYKGGYGFNRQRFVTAAGFPDV